MNSNNKTPHDNIEVLQVGEDALLFVFSQNSADAVPLPVQQRIWQLKHWLSAQRQALGLLEIVPGMGNLLLRSAHTGLLNTLQDLVLARWPQLPEQDVDGQHFDIPVHYGGTDGPDLDAAARHCGLSAQELITRHSAVVYRVYCLGFQPGFAYLGQLDEALHIPRLATPRLAIPAGSVAIAGTQSAIYPSSSPGGWHIIGRTTLALFSPQREPAALLQAGDSVRFVTQETLL